MNMVEIWFGILTKKVLRNGSFTSPREVRKAIDRFLEAHNQDAHPFEWTKKEVKNKRPQGRYADLCK